MISGIQSTAKKEKPFIKYIFGKYTLLYDKSGNLYDITKYYF